MITEDKRAGKIKERWKRWFDARADWDVQAREDIDFYLGNHFTDAEVQELSERNQMGLPIARLYAAIEQLRQSSHLSLQNFLPLAERIRIRDLQMFGRQY